MRKLPRYQYCFVCGRNNQAGTDVTWINNAKEVMGEYHAKDIHNSYKGVIHGGIISALLDEGIGWAVAVRERKMCVTGSLNITFKKPVLVGMKVIVKGFWSDDQPVDKKYHKGTGVIVDNEGVIYATGEGIYFSIPDEIEPELMKVMEVPDNIIKEVTFEDLWGSSE